MFLSFQEFIDIIIMTAILGFLFKDSFRLQATSDDPLLRYTKPTIKKWDGFLFAVKAIAPSVILHELAHKFVAMGFGLQATFHAFYANTTTLFLGVFAIVAKLTGMGFVFLVPGFVRVIGEASPIERAIIAFAGPALHGIFWVIAHAYMKYGKNMSRKTLQFLQVTKYINGFLFILNMLPIPGIDGFTVYTSLMQLV